MSLWNDAAVALNLYPIIQHANIISTKINFDEMKETKLERF